MRGIVALAVIAALTVCPLAAQGQVTAGETAVTCQEAVVYARASQSQEQDRLEAGTAVEVMALRDQWAKIGYGNQQVGYVLKSVLEPDAQPQEEASIPTLVGRYVYVTAQVKMESGDGSNLTTLYPGDQVQLLGVEADQAQVLLISRSGSVPQNVLALDQAGGYPLGQDGGQDNLDMETRLEELGYMDGVPDATFDIQGVEAVLRLRGQAGLSDQFEIDEEFLDLLQDGQAPLSPILSASLEQGDSGDLVRRLQSRLTAKGYLEDATLGNYDLYTAQAVSLYQQVEGMEETGRADSATLARLFSGEVLPLPEDMDPVSAGGSSYLAGGPVVNIDCGPAAFRKSSPGGVALITRHRHQLVRDAPGRLQPCRRAALDRPGHPGLQGRRGQLVLGAPGHLGDHRRGALCRQHELYAPRRRGHQGKRLPRPPLHPLPEQPHPRRR